MSKRHLNSIKKKVAKGKGATSKKTQRKNKLHATQTRKKIAKKAKKVKKTKKAVKKIAKKPSKKPAKVAKSAVKAKRGRPKGSKNKIVKIVKIVKKKIGKKGRPKIKKISKIEEPEYIPPKSYKFLGYCPKCKVMIGTHDLISKFIFECPCGCRKRVKFLKPETRPTPVISKRDYLKAAIKKTVTMEKEHKVDIVPEVKISNRTASVEE